MSSSAPKRLEPTRKAYWNPAFELTFYQSPSFPSSIPAELISCAFVFIFDKNHSMLMGKHALRGYDLPGGKREKEETAEEAACRETKEEVGLSLSPSDLRFFGYEQVHDPAPTPHNPKFPFPDNYFVHYIAKNVDSTRSYIPRSSKEGEVEQMTETRWFTVHELREHKWFVQRPNVLDEILKELSEE
eukprot:Phypoly_transcript_10464.p1 GENE.Phypoly_transcript_10464~~Phypoly_transcript_10464.p1  ORF type:complete len:187 (+),score=31.95 Phypoly_transcript_10464:527-1087(+)